MTRTIAIKGVEFEVAAPYTAGPTELTEAEAKVLNQTRAENIANNFRKRINAALELESDQERDEAMAKIREDFTKYEADYEFTMAAAGGGSTMTPLEREARKAARTWLSNQLKAKDVTVKAYKESVGEEGYEAKLEEIAAHPEIQKLAKKALAEKEKAAGAALEVEL